MRKLCHPEWEHVLNVTEGKNISLVIENYRTFRDYVEELYMQAEGESGLFVLSNDQKILKIQDSLEVISSPLSIDFQNRRILSKVSSELKSLVNSPDLFFDVQEVLSAVGKYAEAIRNSCTFPIQFELPSPADTLKMLSISVDVEYKGLLEKTLEYMNVMHDICGVSIFVLLSARTYFSAEEIDLLLGECSSLKHTVILMDNQEHEKFSAFDQRVLIDVDNCEVF